MSIYIHAIMIDVNMKYQSYQNYRTVSPYINEYSRTAKNGIKGLTISRIERYLELINRDADCWTFISKTKEKYPRFHNILTHRIAYELYKGKIPRGLTIDHLCMNTWCQNPTHLEAVTIEENSQRYNNFVLANK